MSSLQPVIWIVFGISLVCAVWDVRTRRLPVWLFCVIFSAGIVYAVCDQRMWHMVVLSMLPGLSLLLICALTEGAVGAGDGMFFISLSGFLSPGEEMVLLLLSLLLAALVSLVIFCRKKNRNMTLPFLGFVPAAVLLMAGRWIG